MHQTVRPFSGTDPGDEFSTITLRLPAGFGRRCAAVAGDFTAWVPVLMDADADGGYRLGMRVRCGHRFKYRFLVDDESWMNDPLANAFDPGPNGAPASVVVT